MAEVTTELMNEMECDLMVAKKQGDVVAYVVRYGPHYTEGLAVAQALIDRLRDRGLAIRVDTARADNGLALLIEDVSPLAAA